MTLILGIETSCDDTCAAVVTRAGEVRSNVIASQGLLHARYGGVVPEIASRRHLELIDAVIAIRDREKIDPASVSETGLRVNPLVLSITGVVEPSTGLQSKFSMLHSAAVALIDDTDSQYVSRPRRNSGMRRGESNLNVPKL